MLPRVLMAVPLQPGTRIAASDEQSHYLLRVLRLAQGAPLQVFDGLGARHEALIGARAGARCLIEIGDAVPATPESPLQLTLAQALSSADKMDWTIEKAVELGAARIVPLASRRSTVRLDAERSAKRQAHWQRLVEAACMQCGRDRLPIVEPLHALDDWLESASGGEARLVLDPRASISLSAWTSRRASPPSITLLAGPESGLAPEEIERAQAAGFEGVHLGPRVLRTETAGLAALAALQFAFGDL